MKTRGNGDQPEKPTCILRMVDCLPDCGGLFVHYTNSAMLSDGWESIDIRALVEERHEVWLDELVAWHERLAIHAKSTWWWLLPASRLYIFQEPVRPLLFALGILEMLRRRHTATIIYAVGCPSIVGRYVQELSEDSVIVEGKFGPFSQIRRTLRRLLSLVKEVAAFLGRIRRRKYIVRSRSQADLLVFSLGLSKEVLEERGDHFFGRVFDNDRDRVQWLYHLGPHSMRGDASAQLAMIGRRFVDLYPVSLREAKEILLFAYRIRCVMNKALDGLPNLQVNGSLSRLFPQQYFKQLAIDVLPLLELTVMFVMSRLLSDVNPRVVAYPYEEKGLERAILFACQQHDLNIQTVALAHAVYNPELLYMREVKDEAARPPRPSVLAVTGEAMRDWLRRQGRIDTIVVVGSPRVGSIVPRRLRSQSAPLRVLLLVGHGCEIECLADWLTVNLSLFAECEVKVRAYPYGWSGEQKAAMLRLREAGIQFAEGPFEKQVGGGDVILFCSTSAGIEAIMLGRLTVYVALHDLCPTDPFAGKVDGDALLRCDTAEQLKRMLLRISAMSDDEYRSIVSEQRRLAGKIYEPFRVDARKVFGLTDADSGSVGELQFAPRVAPIV